MRKKQKPLSQQPCASRWMEMVIRTLQFARTAGMQIYDLSRITGLTVYQCETALWLAGRARRIVSYKRANKSGGSRWWAIEFQSGYLAEVAISKRSKRALASHNLRERKRDLWINGDGFDDVPVHRLVSVADCVILKPGPASVWDLAA